MVTWSLALGEIIGVGVFGGGASCLTVDRKQRVGEVVSATFYEVKNYNFTVKSVCNSNFVS
jgi:hypothetical protein